MFPHEVSSGFNKILIYSSSETSDSESILEEDLKSGENYINKQWEAIERTLYQEPGQHVTEPELLKECKLWRETFPHFRVKGTKIDINQPDDKVDECEKSIQTFKNHLNIQKLEEKKESIKKKVVGELVDRLIAKYGFEIEESLETEKKCTNGVQITEIDDENSEKSSPLAKNNIPKEIKKNSLSSSAVNTNKESYFERGKQNEDDGLTVEEMEKNLYDIFTSWEEECKTAKQPQNCDSKKLGNPAKQNLTSKSSHSSASLWYKPKTITPPLDSLASIEKPYEIPNKIDKKYEGLIERIMERKVNEFETTRHCHSSASRLEMKSYRESLEKLRKESGFNEYLKKKDKPKLNNFNNNWLKRSEANSCMENNFYSKKTQNPILSTKKSSNLYKEKKEEEIDDKFLENLRAELKLQYKMPTRKNGIVEEIGLRKPKLMSHVTGKSFKSSSSGDLPKKNKKEIKNRQLQSGLEIGKSESNLKNRVKSNKLNNYKGSKSNGNQNPLLPPIESGLICKEIKPMGSKNIKRRY